MSIKLIIFDLWQTLIPATIDFDYLFSLIVENNISKDDFIPVYEKSVQLKKYSNINSMKKDFFKAFTSVDPTILEKQFNEVYTNRLNKIQFFPDVKKNLLKLKPNYYLALLSNTENIPIKFIEKKLELNKLFDFLGYSFETNYLKPDKRAFEYILNKFNVLPSEAVMIGDSLRSDICGAKKAGLYAILINREHSFFDNVLIKPDFEINSFNELEKVLGVLNEKN